MHEIRMYDDDGTLTFIEKEGKWELKSEQKEKYSATDVMLSIIIFPFAVLLGLLISSVIFIPMSIIHAYVLQNLWLWFVVPTFQTPELNFLVCWGLMLMFFLLTGKGNTYSEAKIHNVSQKKLWINIGTNMTGPFFILLVSYIIKCYL